MPTFYRTAGPTGRTRPTGSTARRPVTRMSSRAGGAGRTLDPGMATSTETTTSRSTAKAGTAGLALAALGIVFGDIGTSPLYAFRKTFEHHSIPVD
ncbi:MAG: KUP/HAK/KT family potassium transporter, partial [Actinomycetes bacterium]